MILLNDLAMKKYESGSFTVLKIMKDLSTLLILLALYLVDGCFSKLDLKGNTSFHSYDAHSGYESKLEEATCYPLLTIPISAPGQSLVVMMRNKREDEAEVQLSDALPIVSIPGLGHTTIRLQTAQLQQHDGMTGSLSCVRKPSGVDISTVHIGSCSAYLKLSTSQAGSRYEVITWKSTAPDREYRISVTSLVQDVIIEVSFPAGNCRVSYDGLLFLCGDTVKLNIEAYQTISLTSTDDLTGTIVNSPDGPVSVFVGGSNLTVGPSNVTDSTISELLPESLWGTRYAVASIPENYGSGYSLVISSSSKKASVTVNGMVQTIEPGNPLVVDCTDNKPRYVESEGQIQVIQFVHGSTNSNDSGAPASIVIPSMEEFTSSFSFSTPPGYTHYLMLIIDMTSLMTDKNNLTALKLDGVSLGSSDWVDISGTSLVTRNIKISGEGFGQIVHSLGSSFMTFRYSFERGNCAYGYPAGMKTSGAGSVTGRMNTGFSSVSRFSTNFPSPGVTNLNSGSTPNFDIIYESTNSEGSDNISTPMASNSNNMTSYTRIVTSFPTRQQTGDFTTVSAGRTSFPTRLQTSDFYTTLKTPPTEPSVGCNSDNLGLNFLIAFMENWPSGGYNLEIYPTTFSGRPNISVDVFTPIEPPKNAFIVHDISEKFTLTPGDMHIINVPSYLEMVGIERGTKAVQIMSTERIGVYGMNSVNGSCDGFLAFPISSLATNYYSMAYFPPNHKSQIGVIATQNNTWVNVTLRLGTRPGLNIVWDNKVYANGDTIPFQLNEYETLQLQDFSDLSGTHITSNYPIAVFSGNDYRELPPGDDTEENPSHLVEQIPPIDYWGYTFYIVSIPDSAAGFLLKVVSAFPDTVMTSLSSSPGSSPVNVNLPDPGDFKSNKFSSGIFVRVTSNKPLLVGLFAGSDEMSHPAMLILPPAELYKSWYTFSTGHSVFSNFSHYLLVVIDRSALPGLTVDGEVVDQEGWTSFPGELDKVGKAINITSGVHLVRQMNDVPFGAYVYGSATDHCAYAYPAGLCLGSTESTTAGSTEIITTYTTGLVETTTSKSITTTDSITSAFSTAFELSTTTMGHEVPVLPNITDCTCLQLESSLQPLYNGFYYKSAELHSGFPFYRRMDCDLYIYGEPESKSWMVGQTLGDNRAAIQSTAGLYSSPQNILDWSAYSSDNASFVVDSSTKVICSCPAITACESVEFINMSSGRSYFDGVFTRLDTTREGHPVFQHEDGRLYLFYVGPSEPLSTCQYWTVDADPKSPKSGVLRLYSPVQDPASMDSDFIPWLEYNSQIGRFTEQPTLRLECYKPSTVTS